MTRGEKNIFFLSQVGDLDNNPTATGQAFQLFSSYMIYISFVNQIISIVDALVFIVRACYLLSKEQKS